MICYHGSKKTGITALQPYHTPDSNYGEPCVYLSTWEEIAAMYVWTKLYKFFTFEFGQEGSSMYVEWFPDSLEYFYRGVSGCIYRVEGEFEEAESVGIRCAVISRVSVPVLDCREVPDACEELLRWEREGRLTILRYHEISDGRREAIRCNMLSTIAHHKLLDGVHPMAALVKEQFPAVWEEALRGQV